MELGSYCWKKDMITEAGLNEPEDRDNHLMDALRYAFYDVNFFHPDNPNVRQRMTVNERFERDNGIRADDFNGGWS